MTTVAAILSSDSRGPCALYFVTDSQITYSYPQKKTGLCKKVFASYSSPDIFCFCGDAINTPKLIESFINSEFIDDTEDVYNKHNKLKEIAENFINKNKNNLGEFTIYHGTREFCGMKSIFHLWSLSYKPFQGICNDKILLERSPTEDYEGSGSFIAKTMGSGGKLIIDEKKELSKTEQFETTRLHIMSSFSSINSCKDIYTNGPPQLIGLWRINNAMQFGIYWRKNLYIADKCFNNNIPDGTNWFNDKFEWYDPKTSQRLKGTQQHRRPKHMRI